MSFDRPLEMKAKIAALLELETQLFGKGYKIAESIIQRNENWQKDIRYTTFNTLSSIVRYARLNLIFRENFLQDSNWWNTNYRPYFAYMDPYFGIAESDRIKGSADMRQIVSDDFVKTMMVGLYASCFSMMESRFRIFYDYLINSKDKGQINGLKINKLISKVLDSIDMSSKIGCIDLFRYVRNTVNNNGVYTQNDDRIYCKEKPYHFLKGVPPTYGDSLDLLILVILPIVIEILDLIIDKVLGEQYIIDPFTV